MQNKDKNILDLLKNVVNTEIGQYDLKDESKLNFIKFI